MIGLALNIMIQVVVIAVQLTSLVLRLAVSLVVTCARWVART